MYLYDFCKLWVGDPEIAYEIFNSGVVICTIKCCNSMLNKCCHIFYRLGWVNITMPTSKVPNLP